MRRVCVFCGSSPGASPRYLAAANSLGVLLAQRGLGLVYGGASVGLMGKLADAVLGEGGEVIGVIPSAMVTKEVAHAGLLDLRVVDSMHERNALMADLSDAFIALPGGIGTLEELLEILTWSQLGIHDKPCGVLNVRGYFDGLLTLLDHVVAERFMRPEHRAMLLAEPTAEALLDAFERYEVPLREKWLDRDET